MYPEFIAIYIGLAVLIGLAIAILVMLVKIKKSGSGFSARRTSSTPEIKTQASTYTPASTPSSGNVVFCKKCATRFDANEKFCPKCGTPR